MTIEINDLPLLQDLTPEQLKKLFGAGRVRPTFEQLEDRLVQSGISYGAYLGSASAASSAWASPDYTQLAPAPATTAVVAVIATEKAALPPALAAVGQIDMFQQAVLLAPATTAVATVDPTQQAVLPPALAAVVGWTSLGDSGIHIIDKPASQYLPALDLTAQVTPVAPFVPVDYSEVFSPALDLNAQVTPVESAALPADYSQVSAMNVLGGQINAASQEKGRIAIADKVAQLGASLGRPLGESHPDQYGYGRIQNFDDGKSIFWSPTTGAHVVQGLIRREYNTRGGSNWGYPSTDAMEAPRSPGVIQHFDKFTYNYKNPLSTTPASIYWTEPTGAHTISDQIFRKWADVGGTDYGIPVSDQYDNVRTGSRLQDFTTEWGNEFIDVRTGGRSYSSISLDSRSLATIVWSSQTGAHDVVGSIRDKWRAMGGSDFGLPTTDSTKYDGLYGDKNGANGIVHFKDIAGNGSAIVTSTGGAFSVVGLIYNRWLTLGTQNFGSPNRDEFADVVHGGRISTFTSPDGFARAIRWNGGSGTDSHFYVNNGDGQGWQELNFKPTAGPTGFEPVAGRTETSSAPLTADPNRLDLSAAYQQSMSDTQTGALSGNLLSASGYDLAAPVTPVGSNEAILAAFSPTLDLTEQFTPVESAVLPTPYDQVHAPAMNVRSDQSQNEGRRAIAAKVVQLGNQLGRPLPGFKESQETGSGSGRVQHFEDGKSIYWSLDTGAHLVVGGILKKFLGMGGMGYPMFDEEPLPGWPGGRVSEFSRADGQFASIVWTPQTGAHVIWGAIYGKWGTLGVEVGGREVNTGRALGTYGVPLAGEYAVAGGGRAQDFRRFGPGGPVVTISWSPQTGAHEVDEAVRDTWISLGREQWGYPTGGYYKGPSAAGNLVSVDFTGLASPGSLGTIVASKFGTYYTQGAIRQEWSKLGALGWGIPISNEISLDGGKVRYSEFLAPGGTQVSRIVWFQSTERTIIQSNVRTLSGTQSLAGFTGNASYYQDIGRLVDAASRPGMVEQAGQEIDLSQQAAIVPNTGFTEQLAGTYFQELLAAGTAPAESNPVQQAVSLSRGDGKIDLSQYALSQYAFLPNTGYEQVAVERFDDYANLISPAPELHDPSNVPAGDVAGGLQVRSYESQQEQGRIAISSDDTAQWLPSDMPPAGMADYANLFGREMKAVEAALPFIPSSPSVIEQVPWDTFDPSVYETAFNSDIGLWPEYTAGQDIAPVLDGGDVSFQAASPSTREQLQARLAAELDQSVAQSQQELLGALDAQPQYTAEHERVATDIQAAAEVSSEETAPNLADLQASRMLIATALEQNQQQIALLQNQLDLFTTEQALIGSALAEADVAGVNELDKGVVTTDFESQAADLSDQATEGAAQLATVEGRISNLQVAQGRQEQAIADIGAQRDEYQVRVGELDQALTQTRLELQAAQDGQSAIRVEALPLEENIQAATTAV